MVARSELTAAMAAAKARGEEAQAKAELVEGLEAQLARLREQLRDAQASLSETVSKADLFAISDAFRRCLSFSHENVSEMRTEFRQFIADLRSDLNIIVCQVREFESLTMELEEVVQAKQIRKLGASAAPDLDAFVPEAADSNEIQGQTDFDAVADENFEYISSSSGHNTVIISLISMFHLSYIHSILESIERRWLCGLQVVCCLQNGTMMHSCVFPTRMAGQLLHLAALMTQVSVVLKAQLFQAWNLKEIT
jgi:hypothetical protein